MIAAELLPGTRVFDPSLRRFGFVVGLHKPGNPNLDVEEATIRVSENALIWANIGSLQLAKEES
jgi:hypothetical protein